MSRNTKSFFLFLIIFIYSNSFAQYSKLDDVIAPVKLIAGKPDTILVSDLYYSDNYNISFDKRKGISVDYNKNNLELIVTADSALEGITSLNFEERNKTYSIPIFIKKINKHTFSFKPGKPYKSIYLFGSFNSWNRQEFQMKDDGSGIYKVSVPLEPGRYEYKFFVDGDEILDPQNPETVPNGIGGINSVITIPDPHSEKIFLHKINYSPGKTAGEFKFYLETEKPHSLGESNIFAWIDNLSLDKKNIGLDNGYINITIPNSELAKSKMLRIVVSINGLNSNVQMIPLQNGKPEDGKIFSWYDGMIYSLMIDRFNDGNKKNDLPVKNDSLSWKANYQGGDFVGVTQKINAGYFDSLCINTIWISPVNDNPDEAFKESPPPHRWFTGYHGYWPISATKVEEKFGTFNDLKNLIKTAHKHHIKVLLDFVSHHVHQENPLFKEHRDWFGHLKLPDGTLNLRMWDDHRLTTWFDPYLPSFDFINSRKAVDFMSDNAIWWLEKTGADGFRHDAVKHVPNIFWRTLTKKLKKEIEVPRHEDVYQIGETFGNYDLVSSYVNNGQLSGQFNFELYNTAQAVFIDPKRSFKDLETEMDKTIDVYGPLHLMGNIMDSHDKNRFMAYADNEIDLSEWNATEKGWKNPPTVKDPYSYKKCELYYAYMFSIPGLPVIYYGSEFGMTGLSDPDNRRMMRFGNQLDKNERKMLDVVRQIVNVRKNNLALRYGDFYTLRADDKFYAFIRSDFYERVLVVLNKSDEKQNLDLNIPEIYSSGTAVNLIDKSVYQVEGNKVKVSLEPRGWMMLKLK